MKPPKIRFEELQWKIEILKYNLAKKGRFANFDYRILVVEAELKGIAETMEFITKNGINRNREFKIKV